MMVIQIDSRERQSNITKYFDEIGQKYVISKMIAGDYQDVVYFNNEVLEEVK